MKARLLKDQENAIFLLHANGTISNASATVLANFLLNFKSAGQLSGNDGKWVDTYRDMSMYPGETIAYVADDLSLIIFDFTVFNELINDNYLLSNFISLGEYAKKVNKSREIIKVLCRNGRIPGAQKKANRWIIPKDAPYPVPPSRQREGWQQKRAKLSENKID